MKVLLLAWSAKCFLQAKSTKKTVCCRKVENILNCFRVRYFCLYWKIQICPRWLADQTYSTWLNCNFLCARLKVRILHSCWILHNLCAERNVKKLPYGCEVQHLCKLWTIDDIAICASLLFLLNIMVFCVSILVSFVQQQKVLTFPLFYIQLNQ